MTKYLRTLGFAADGPAKKKYFEICLQIHCLNNKFRKSIINSNMPQKTAKDLKKLKEDKQDLENELKLLDDSEKPEEAAKEVIEYVLKSKEPLLEEENPFRPNNHNCVMFRVKTTVHICFIYIHVYVYVDIYLFFFLWLSLNNK
ncbi:hypothetical protein RFI_14311 [Reticulomyxa filosa]|uniref:Uncharacterized protein n=1 Tax=Reticulomyxa filosa TaxID=46433 RepID=X6NA61_RETFI|nr:hypothetical protein RFI_14311 [Reticulomyxa filosa]|eukprot:ETO22881.1 hypothetical protein RFI_14311 [Reticulomyxa filosa]